MMTVEELAAYLRVSPWTIYRMLKRKELPAFRVGGDWRFRRANSRRSRTAACSIRDPAIDHVDIETPLRTYAKAGEPLCAH